MIFFLPGLLLVNAAIVKDDYVQEQQDLSQRGGQRGTLTAPPVLELTIQNC